MNDTRTRECESGTCSRPGDAITPAGILCGTCAAALYREIRSEADSRSGH